MFSPHRLGLVSTRTHYFELVSRLGSIRKAASSLNVAPSSVSRVIRQLEDELGTTLFERGARRMRLTSAGELLLYHVRVSNRQMGRAVDAISDLQGMRRGEVSVAVVESVARGVMPEVLARFWSEFPEIAVHTTVATSADAMRLVAEGDCDLGVAFDLEAVPRVRRLAVISVPLGVLCHPDDPLAAMSAVRLSDLAHERLVMSDATLSTGLQPGAGEGEYAPLSHLRGGPPVGRSNSIALMIDTALSGVAKAIQTPLGARREIAEERLVFVPLKGERVGRRRLSVLARPASETPNAAAPLLRVLIDEIEGSVNGFTDAVPSSADPK